MQLKHTNLVSHITTLSRFIVFMTVIGFLLIASLLTQQEVNAIQTSNSISNTYQYYVLTLVKEETLEHEYALNPDINLRHIHLMTRTTLSNLLLTLQHETMPEDTPLIQSIISLQTRYLFSSDEYFSAIDAGDITHANTILSQDINPTFNRIIQALHQQMEREANRSAHALAQLKSIQRTFFTMGMTFFILGTIILAVTMYITNIYRQKLDEATQAEIAHLEYLALTDPLTNLGNHHAYQEEITRAWKETQQSQETLALAMLDIDEFKLLNDEQGHQRGDEVLLNIANVLRDSHCSDALFRLAADDFVILLPHTTLAEAVIIFERLCKDIRHLWGVTLSVGITSTEAKDLTLEAFQAQSLLALQEAKRLGRNRILTFEKVADDASFVPLAKRQALRRILSERQLNVAFQPIWHLATGTLLAFEALARPATDAGFNGPQELFDVAEQMGRAHELDVICVRSILARAAELPPNALLFMNLTPQSLVHDLLTNTILMEMVTSAGLNPSRVVLEITERSIVKLTDLVQKAHQLQKLGFRIALDDAGAGNAGLEMMSKLTVDFIKVDRSIVVKALTDASVRAIFTGITSMAQQMNSDVIAEGIEGIEMLNFVQEVGVQAVQGYLTGRPTQVMPSTQELQMLSPLAQRTASSSIVKI